MRIGGGRSGRFWCDRNPLSRIIKWSDAIFITRDLVSQPLLGLRLVTRHALLEHYWSALPQVFSSAIHWFHARPANVRGIYGSVFRSLNVTSSYSSSQPNLFRNKPRSHRAALGYIHGMATDLGVTTQGEIRRRQQRKLVAESRGRRWDVVGCAAGCTELQYPSRPYKRDRLWPCSFGSAHQSINPKREQVVSTGPCCFKIQSIRTCLKTGIFQADS
jgi:hypothetical protein